MKLNPRALTFRLSALAFCGASMRKRRRCDDRTLESERYEKKKSYYLHFDTFFFIACARGSRRLLDFSLLLRSSLPYVKRDDIKYKYVIITNWSCVLCETSHCVRLDFINCRCYLKQQRPKWWMKIYHNSSWLQATSIGLSAAPTWAHFSCRYLFICVPIFTMRYLSPLIQQRAEEYLPIEIIRANARAAFHGGGCWVIDSSIFNSWSNFSFLSFFPRRRSRSHVVLQPKNKHKIFSVSWTSSNTPQKLVYTWKNVSGNDVDSSHALISLELTCLLQIFNPKMLICW